VNFKNTLLLSDILKINTDLGFIFLFAHYYPLKAGLIFQGTVILRKCMVFLRTSVESGYYHYFQE